MKGNRSHVLANLHPDTEELRNETCTPVLKVHTSVVFGVYSPVRFGAGMLCMLPVSAHGRLFSAML